MKKITNFLTSKFLWVLIGLICFVLLIWFFGPLISVAEFKPLENKWVRLSICLFVMFAWLVRNLFKRYKVSRKNAELINEIKVAQEPMLKNVSSDSEMSKQFEEIDTILKKAKFSNSKSWISKFSTGQYLYQMPWYVVIGVAGSGKTSALERSGLNFPLESSFGSSSISGLAGTRDCDWFLSDEAVLLDTAGRLSIHNTQNEQDKYDWREFLSLLKRYRPKKPVNGVVVTLGIDDLLGDEASLKSTTFELKKRISEMIQHFETNFPVYLMITKLDKLEGFTDFFAHISHQQKELSLGFQLEGDVYSDDEQNNEYEIGYVSKQLSLIEDNINATSIRLIDDLDSIEERNSAFMFSEEFSSVKEKLLLLFKELHKSSKFESKVLWRGIYFTSAKQEGNKIDPMLNSLGNEFELTKKYSSESPKNSNESYFLNRLFKNIIFKEHDLASENKSWLTKRGFIYALGLLSALLFSGIVVALMVNSYYQNKKYLNQVTVNSESLKTKTSKQTLTKDLYEAVEFANKVGGLSVPENQNSMPTFSMGLDQSQATSSITDSAYQRILQDSVMPLISYKIDEILRNEKSALEIDKYNALKAYLMMFDKEKFDSEFIYNWLMKYLSRENSVQKEVQIKDALKKILSQETFIPSVPYDKNLVEIKRREISSSDIANMILSDTFSQVMSDKNAIAPLSFESMGGIQTRLVFTRKSGKSITEPMNSMYSKDVYQQYVLPNLIKSTSKIFKEENWVLGKYAYIKSNEINTFEEAQKLYFNQFISAWNAYLSDLTMIRPKGLRNARDFAQVLSDKNNSPLSNLIKAISYNTNLGMSKEVEKKASGVSQNLLQRLISKSGLSRLNIDAEVAKGLNSTIEKMPIVDKEFVSYHLLTNRIDGNEAVIDQVTSSIDELYKYLDVLNIAVEKGIELPSDQSLFIYRAEVNRLPNPFRAMFDDFSQFILKKGINEKDHRNKIEEDKKRKEEEDRKKELRDREREQKKELQKQKELEEQKKNEAELKYESELIANLDRQFSSVSMSCKKLKKSGYPFQRLSNKDTKLTEFAKVFNKNSGYHNFLKLNPDVKRHFNVSNFDDLLSKDYFFANKYSAAKRVNVVSDAFFVNNSLTPKINFEIKFTYLDNAADKIVLDYNKKKYTYNHGPIYPIQINWPMSNGKTLSLSLYKNNKNIGSVKYQGEWALFKLIESGTIKFENNNKLTSDLEIDGRKVTIAVESFSQFNPFRLDVLRRFKCS